MRLMFSAMTLAACLLMVQPAAAQSCSSGGCSSAGAIDSCGHCGIRARCQKKTVQVVCDVKKVKQICWAVECETFRPPIPVGYGKKPDCNPDPCGGCGTGSCGSCSKGPHGLVPACAPGKCRVKKKLMMREIEVEIPVYKAEVQYLCPTCCDGCGGGSAPAEEADAPIPAPVPQQASRVVPMPTS